MTGGATTEKPINILLIDDSKADVRLTREALKNTQIPSVLNTAHDGVEAMKYLHKLAPYEQAETPDLILLDLNMPKKDGREVLSEVKSDERLKKIPVLILSTSQSEKDIKASYDLHANCYITKPMDFEEFIQTVQRIEDFWLKMVRLPKYEIRG